MSVITYFFLNNTADPKTFLLQTVLPDKWEHVCYELEKHIGLHDASVHNRNSGYILGWKYQFKEKAATYKDKPFFQLSDLIQPGDPIVISRKPFRESWQRPYVPTRYAPKPAPVKTITEEIKMIPVSEEERLLSLINTQAELYAHPQNVHKVHRVQVSIPPRHHHHQHASEALSVPPDSYVCHTCGKKGHWIESCTKKNDPLFRPVCRRVMPAGIPRSMLRKAETEAERNMAWMGEL